MEVEARHVPSQGHAQSLVALIARESRAPATANELAQGSLSQERRLVAISEMRRRAEEVPVMALVQSGITPDRRRDPNRRAMSDRVRVDAVMTRERLEASSWT